ncbi:Fic family protein [Streptococcus caprae]|uniref:Fic family protein n=1 Tax=Streptococcus caprae TaxID=1640501 RepID=A0ABV8CTQ7_9STRE
MGDYKQIPNEVGGRETRLPKDVKQEMVSLLKHYQQQQVVALEHILDFHVQFERIHPFQDGNGRVGRLIMLKECLNHEIVPFIISDDLKYFYYRGLKEWGDINGYLTETCLMAQDRFKEYLRYFRIVRLNIVNLSVKTIKLKNIVLELHNRSENVSSY